MNLDKLAKLDGLHQRGVIDDVTYNKQKKKLLKKRNWWIRIPLSLVGLLLAFNILGYSIFIPSTTAGDLAHLPVCESKAAQTALSNAIKNNDESNIQTANLLSLTNQQQTTQIAWPPERDCTATAYLNDGIQNFGYKLFYPDPKNSNQWLVQITQDN